ncbi:MAG: hypothetical protein ACFB3T_04410 [Geminicoccaceae bacterium]
MIERNDRVPPEQLLWAAVLERAVIDAQSAIAKKKAGQSVTLEEAKACMWLAESHADFNEVCGWASIDPTAARERMNVWLKEAFPLPLVEGGEKRKSRKSRAKPVEPVRQAA